MNCKRIREKVTDALAAGESELSADLALHLRSCDGCCAFYEAQAKLLLSIDTGVDAFVNQELPASFLPGFRARLAKQLPTLRWWIPAWSFAAFAALAILAISHNYFRRQPALPLSFSTQAPVAQPAAGNGVNSARALPKSLATTPSRVHRRTIPPVTIPALPELSTEVIVLAEEREGFARFVAELPKNGDLAVALTNPASGDADLPVEIALLQIESVEVKPLRSTPRE